MSDNKSSRIDPSIIAALIGVAGTIIVTLITLNASKPAATPTPPNTPQVVFTDTVAPSPLPTDTVPVGAPTSTPAPTDTPAPTPTFTFTPLAPPSIGEDWSQGCISALWEPYSSAGPVDAIEKDGCLLQPVQGFFANNGQMSFLYEERVSSAKVVGMFAPLPGSSGSVSIKVALKDLTSSDIWIGFFAEQSIDSQGLLMTIPAGKVAERPFVAWQMPGLNKITSTQFLSQGAGYGVRFEYDAGSVRAVVLPNVFATNTYPISSAQKWLFVGYRSTNGNNRIDAKFFDLTIGK